MRNCTSGSDRDRGAYTVCHCGVEIDVCFWSPDADDQGVPRSLIVSLQRGARSPPPKCRVDGDVSTAREIGGASLPDVSMQRTPVTILRADQPRRITMAPIGSLLFISCRRVYPTAERADRFERSLDIETKTVRCVSIARRNTPLRWVGLDEIGERHPHLDLCLSQALKKVIGPWQVVEVHVASRRLLSWVFLEGMQAFLKAQLAIRRHGAIMDSFQRVRDAPSARDFETGSRVSI